MSTDRSNGTPFRMKLCFATDESAVLHETHIKIDRFSITDFVFSITGVLFLMVAKSCGHIPLKTHQGFSQKPVAEPKKGIRSYRVR